MSTRLAAADACLAELIEALASESTTEIIAELRDALPTAERQGLSPKGQAALQTWRTAARLVLLCRELSPSSPTEH